MPNITVGCKLPAGVIIKSGNKSVQLNGANSARVIGGYGLTQVDKDFFESWKKEYANYGPLKNGLIFDQASQSSAESQAKEQSVVKSGLEPLNPEKIVPGATKADFADAKAA